MAPVAGPSRSQSESNKQIFEITSSDSNDEATDDSDCELLPPHASSKPEPKPARPLAVPASFNRDNKGKGRAEHAIIEIEDSLELPPPKSTDRNASLSKGKGRAVSTIENDRSRDLDRSRYSQPRSDSATLDYLDTAGDADADANAAFARRLYAQLNGERELDGGSKSQTLLPGGFPSLKRKRSRSSSASSTSTDVQPQDDDDAALARRLAQEEEQQQRALAAQEAQDELMARALHAADERAERVKREKEKKGGKVEKIAFQVTMDGEGRTIEGDEDGENMLHLELVRKQFMAGGIANGLKILKVTYFVNFELNARFEAAKDALAEQGRDATERTLFHGTAEKNLQPILEDGFRIGGVDHKITNGKALGIGVYLASTPSTSMPYCVGGNKMFACRVVTGLTTRQHQHGKPRPVGQNAFDAYEHAGVVVARTADQVLPRYLVEFEWPGYGVHAGVGGGLFAGLANVLGLGGAVALPPAPARAPAAGTSKRRASRKKAKRVHPTGLQAAAAAAAANAHDREDPDDEPGQYAPVGVGGGFGRARPNPLAGVAAGPQIDPVTMQPLDPAEARKRRRKKH